MASTISDFGASLSSWLECGPPQVQAAQLDFQAVTPSSYLNAWVVCESPSVPLEGIWYVLYIVVKPFDSV